MEFKIFFILFFLKGTTKATAIKSSSVYPILICSFKDLKIINYDQEKKI